MVFPSPHGRVAAWRNRNRPHRRPPARRQGGASVAGTAAPRAGQWNIRARAHKVRVGFRCAGSTSYTPQRASGKPAPPKSTREAHGVCLSTSKTARRRSLTLPLVAIDFGRRDAREGETKRTKKGAKTTHTREQKTGATGRRRRRPSHGKETPRSTAVRHRAYGARRQRDTGQRRPLWAHGPEA